ncbi:MAG: nucleotidyltransferase [Christensenellales bacterium]
MKVCAIIAEYNPFHLGHAYQIHIARNNFDHVIVIMSGNFVQRGESACYDKWLRTKWALLAGASLVLELPACFALQSAQRFALGAVSILNELGIVDALVFGSESNNLALLTELSDFLFEETDEFKSILKANLKQGSSYIKSRQNAAEHMLGLSAKEIIASPNDVLGIEYIRALRQLGSKIAPFPVQRKGAGHHETALDHSSSFASASSIRKALLANQMNAVAAHVPDFVYADMVRLSEKNDHFPVRPDQFEDIIIALLRRMQPEELRNYPDVSEGLEYRLKKAADSSQTLKELLEKTVASRYTAARIRRIVYCVLLCITKELSLYNGPLYARLLGFQNNAKDLLSDLQESCAIPYIMKAASFPKSHPSWPVFQADLRGSDLYALALEKEKSRSGRDYTEPLVII